jgi:peptide/nickel transport system substrate-binding protein
VTDDRHRLTRRAALCAALSAASVALLAACATPAPSAPTPTAGAGALVTGSLPAKSDKTPKAGGKMTVGLVGDIITLDGHSQAGPLQVNVVWHHFDKLTEYDDNVVPQPSLAESWDFSSDATKLKLNLRKGVQFHSGREFLSEDVKYNLLRLRDPKNVAIARSMSGQSNWWTSIETPDKYTVVLTSDKPRPGAFDLFQYMNIVDKDMMEGPEATTKTGGTGPFKFVEWVSGDHFTSVKNPNYWRSGHPLLDEVTTRFFKDPQSLIATFEAGAIDLAFAPPLNDAARLKDNPKYTYIGTSNLGQWFYVSTNTTVAPTNNKQVRQALNYAIDRQRWTDTVLRGLSGGAVDLPWPAASPAYDASKNKVYTFDPEKAASLLKSAGVGSINLDINYSTAGFGAEYAALAQIYQADLARIGVTTTLKPVEAATFTNQGLQLSYSGIRLSAGAYANLFESGSMLNLGFGLSANAEGFVDQRLADLVNAAAVEPDATNRKQLYAHINDFMLDECFRMPISLYPSNALAKNTLNGLRVYFNPVMTYQDAWIA